MNDTAILEPTSREEFEKTLKEAKGAVVVDFWAKGCGSCDPADLQKLATDCREKATIMRIESSEGWGSKLADEWNVEGTPTTLLAMTPDKMNAEDALEVDPASEAARKKLKCARPKATK